VQHKSHNAELRKTNSVSVNKKSAQCAEHRKPKLYHEVNSSLSFIAVLKSWSKYTDSRSWLP